MFAIPLLAMLGLFSPNLPAKVSGMNTPYEKVSAHNTTSWKISQSSTLEWNDKDYVPYGIHIDGSAALVNSAVKIGFLDFCVNLPSTSENWLDTIKALNSSHCRYFIDVNSISEPVEGFSIDPLGNRIINVTQDKHVNLTFPGATSVLAILADQQDGSIEFSKVYQTPNGVLDATFHPLNEVNHAILFYPLSKSNEIPNYWEGADLQRDHLLSSLVQLDDVGGLRGVINPLGTLPAGSTPNPQFVPTSRMFQLNFESFLVQKYRSANALLEAWRLEAPDFSSIGKAARLIPLFYGERGIPKLYDPISGSFYNVDSKASLYWQDVRDTINQAGARRFRRITDSIHKLANVPVLQSWNGWGVPYEGNPEVDGVSFQSNGNTPLQLLDSAARPISSVLRWNKPGLYVDTSFNPSGTSTDSLKFNFELLRSLNVSGIFLDSSDPKIQADFLDVSKSAQSSTAGSVKPIFYPEAATNPAQTQKLADAIWWLPSPSAGNRLDFGSNLKGYRMSDTNGQHFVIWSDNGPQKVIFDCEANLPTSITSSDGSIVSFSKVGGGFEVVVPTLPIEIEGLSEVPAPRKAMEESVAIFKQIMLLPHADAGIGMDYSNAIQTSVDGYQRSPGPSFLAIRSGLRSLARLLGNFAWINGSTPEAADLGETIEDGSSISGKVWRAKSNLSLPGTTLTISYNVNAKKQPVQDLWMAAKIEGDSIDQVNCQLGVETLSMKPSKIGAYGNGYAWYYLGHVSIGDASQLDIKLDNSKPFDISIDAIVVSPDGFVPSGSNLPETAAELASTVPKAKK